MGLGQIPHTYGCLKLDHFSSSPSNNNNKILAQVNKQADSWGQSCLF